MRSQLSSLTIKGLILAGLGFASQTATLLGVSPSPEEYQGAVKAVEVGFELIGLAAAYWGRIRLGDLK